MISADSTLFSHDETAHKSDKSPTALRTISEAAELIDVPQHVLRFWETKFPQIKPLKRNGGRRFYRPQDLDVLLQIKHLLYSQGYTIKGAKKAVDEFIHARAGGVNAKEWLLATPAANVNDNPQPAAARPIPEALAELAQALREPAPIWQDDTRFVAEETRAQPEEQPMPTSQPAVAQGLPATTKDELQALREELMRAKAKLERALVAKPQAA
jgi:DNA-binding transcriptional MerR regulator